MQDDATIKAYDEYAEIYDAEVVEFWEKFPESFLTAFSSLLPGDRVLDVGSGSGRDALLLRDLGLAITCVDASKRMVDITKGLGFESHKADFSEIDFPDSAFHGIWAYTSLIHVSKSDARRAIERLRRLLVPRGVFAIGVIEGVTEGMVERKTMPNASRYFKNYTSLELVKMMESSGFKLTHENKYQPHNSVYLNQIYVKTDNG